MGDYLLYSYPWPYSYHPYQQTYYPRGVVQFELASGWLALFADIDVDEVANYSTDEVLAFASIANGAGEQRMAGMIMDGKDIVPADDYATFICYIREGEYTDEELEEIAVNWLSEHPEVFEEEQVE